MILNQVDSIASSDIRTDMSAVTDSVPVAAPPLSPFSPSSRRPRLPAPKTSPVPQYMANKAAAAAAATSATAGGNNKSQASTVDKKGKFALNMNFNLDKDENAKPINGKQQKTSSTTAAKRTSISGAGKSVTLAPVAAKVPRKSLSAQSGGGGAAAAVSRMAANKLKASMGSSSKPGAKNQVNVATAGLTIVSDSTVDSEVDDLGGYLQHDDDIQVDEGVENDAAVQLALETLFVWDELDGRAFRRLSHEGITVKHLQSIKSFATPPPVGKHPYHDENSPTESFLRQNGLDKSPLPPFPLTFEASAETDSSVSSPRRRALQEIQSGVVPVTSIPFAKHDKGSLTPPPPARPPASSMAPKTPPTPNQQVQIFFDENGSAVSKPADLPRLPPNSTNTTTRRRSLGREAEVVTDTVLDALKEYLKRQHGDLLIRKSPPHFPGKAARKSIARSPPVQQQLQQVEVPTPVAAQKGGEDDLASQLRDMTMHLDEIIQRDFNIDFDDGVADSADVKTAPQTPFDRVVTAVSPSSPKTPKGEYTGTPLTPRSLAPRTPAKLLTPKAAAVSQTRSAPRLSLDPNDWTEVFAPPASTNTTKTPEAIVNVDTQSVCDISELVAHNTCEASSNVIQEFADVAPANELPGSVQQMDVEASVECSASVTDVADPNPESSVPTPAVSSALAAPLSPLPSSSSQPFGYGLHGYFVQALLCGFMTATITERPDWNGDGRFLVSAHIFLDACPEDPTSPDMKVLALKSFEEFVTLAFDMDMNIDECVPGEFQERYLNRWLGDILRAFRPRPASGLASACSDSSSERMIRGGCIPAHSSSRGTQAVILKDFFVPSHDLE